MIARASEALSLLEMDEGGEKRLPAQEPISTYVLRQTDTLSPDPFESQQDFIPDFPDSLHKSMLLTYHGTATMTARQCQRWYYESSSDRMVSDSRGAYVMWEMSV